LRVARLTLSALEQRSFRLLGAELAHALEATARNVEPGTKEQEIAGQIAHRLTHRGIEPVALHAAADGRDAKDVRPFFGDRKCEKSCVMTAIGRRDGLHVAASRTVWFGEPDDAARKQFEAAGQIAAGREIALAPMATPASLFEAGQKVAEAVGWEYAWHETCYGYWTGWLPIEQMLLPTGTQRCAAGHVLTLATKTGSGSTLDTYLVIASGAERVTADEEGPLRRYRFAGRTIDLPDVHRH